MTPSFFLCLPCNPIPARRNTPFMRTFSTVLLGLMLGGCVAEAGQACDGFFTNQCKSPATCVAGPKGAFCGTSCSTRAIPEPGQARTYCEDESMEPVEVSLDNGAPMGCHCLPKAAIE